MCAGIFTSQCTLGVPTNFLNNVGVNIESVSYRIAGNFRGVLIFVIFVVNPGVTKFSTHEIFHLH